MVEREPGHVDGFADNAVRGHLAGNPHARDVVVELETHHRHRSVRGAFAAHPDYPAGKRNAAVEEQSAAEVRLLGAGGERQRRAADHVHARGVERRQPPEFDDPPRGEHQVAVLGLDNAFTKRHHHAPVARILLRRDDEATVDARHESDNAAHRRVFALGDLFLPEPQELARRQRFGWRGKYGGAGKDNGCYDGSHGLYFTLSGLGWQPPPAIAPQSQSSGAWPWGSPMHRGRVR